jgi:hypothetical protein
LGWFLDLQRGHRVVTHSGGLGGFGTCITRYPGDDLTIIILSNREGTNPTALAGEIAGFYRPSLQSPRQFASHDDPDPAHTSLLRSVLAGWAKGIAHPSLTTGLRNYVPVAGLTDLYGRLNRWNRLVYLGEDEVAEQKIERYGASVARICYYRLQGPADSEYVTYFLTSDGRVAQIRIAGE